MKDHQFLHLEESAQTSALWEEGTFLAERLQGFHNIKLYQLDGRYIEVTLHAHFNVVLRVSSYTDTHYLEPYLNAISINELIAP